MTFRVYGLEEACSISKSFPGIELINTLGNNPLNNNTTKAIKVSPLVIKASISLFLKTEMFAITVSSTITANKLKVTAKLFWKKSVLKYIKIANATKPKYNTPYNNCA